MLSSSHSCLIKKMPPTRGRIAANSSLTKMNWFRTGGCADVVFHPEDSDDLGSFLSKIDSDIEVSVLGLGSNTLIRDGGVPGVVIILGKNFSQISFNKNVLTVGAGAADIAVSRACQRHSLGGAEFLSGIPGTIGGAIRMNAGAFGHEISDILVSAVAFDQEGNIKEIKKTDFGFTYRKASINSSWIFLSAKFCISEADPSEVKQKMEAIEKERKTTQPIHVRTGGSTFKNPPNFKAWKLIEAAGCRGLRYGGAIVSEHHCNFLINQGTATSHDLESLGEQVRQRVLENSGISLDWEIRRLGVELKDRN